MPEGESGVVLNNMTDSRAEELGAWYALDKKAKTDSGMPDERAVAEFLGTTVAFVRKAKHDERILKRVQKDLETKLLYDIVETRAVLTKIAKDPQEKTADRIKAVTLMETIAGNVKKMPAAVVNVQQNNTGMEQMDAEELVLIARDILQGRVEPDAPEADD